MDQQNPQPRARRAERHRAEGGQLPPQATRRAGNPPEDEAPLPLGGLDAARPTQRSSPAAVPPRPAPGAAMAKNPPAQQQPPARPNPQRVYSEEEYRAPAADTRGFDIPRYEDASDGDEPYRRRWPWILLAVVILLLATSAAAWFLPGNSTGILGSARGAVHGAADGVMKLLGLKEDEPPRLLRFETPEETVLTGVQTVFTFTASQAIDGVRILDEVDGEITGVAASQNPPVNTVWVLRAVLSRPMTATLRAEIQKNGIWYATEKTVRLTAAALTQAPLPTAPPTPVPTAVPTPEPTAEPTAVPTAVPTAEPTATPTAEPTAAPPTAPPPVITRDPSATNPIAFLLASFTPIPSQGAQVFSTPDLASVTTSAPTETPAIQAMPTAGEQESLTLTPPPAMEQTSVPEQTPEPEQTPVAVVTPQPTPTQMPVLTAQAAQGASPSALGVTEAVYQGGKAIANYVRGEALNLQGNLGYAHFSGGVFTFRGDAMRRNPASGSAAMPLDQMSIKWQTPMASLRTADSGTLYGMGWTGQPVIIQWAKEVREAMNITEEKKAIAKLKEVIFASQDGNVYFLDLADGAATRKPINIGYPLKGSVSADPFNRPMVAFGQGISQLPGKQGDIGFYLYNLLDQSRLLFINGRKSKTQVQYATNGAFDGTALFDKLHDTMIVAGENGLLYTVELNTSYSHLQPDSLSADPEITYLRGKTGKQAETSVSIESSVAMYGQYAFTADKQGILRAIDTTTMKTVWAFDTGDNTDATVALDLEDDTTLALYTGTTVFTRSRKSGNAVIRRLDALTGEVDWFYEIAAKYNEDERNGVKASPVVGDGAISDLVIFTVNGTEGGATMVALHKRTGAVVWTHMVPAGAISSPVAVYTKDGRARVVQAGLDGTLYLLDGPTGRVLDTLDLGGTIEGSPAVYDDILVIGTCDKNNNFMYGIRLE